jgi:tRNA(Ile)-lysidine synthase
VFEIVQNQLERQLNQVEKPKLLLACSGGVDSMVLLYLLQKSNYSIAVAHCNFLLRETASDRDAAFVSGYCIAHGLQYFEQSFKTKDHAKTKGISTQMVARELRYQWFDTLKNDHEFTHLLTAHHLDDQLETFLINLGRGSGIKGLSGIPDQIILRPLLKVSKEDIMAYAKENKISWREDASNAEEDYLRNQLRHQLIPKWKAIQPNLIEQLEKSQQQLRMAEEALAVQCDQFIAEYFIAKENYVAISIEALQTLKPLTYYLHALFSPYGFTHFSDLNALLGAQSGKQLFSVTHRLLKDRGVLLLSPVAQAEGKEIFHWTPTEDLIFPIKLRLGEDVAENAHSAILATEALKYPLILRKYKEGDYFYPVVMKGKKKLSKFFKDQKYSLLEKEQQWLLCSGGEIVWVVGQRVDARFAATSETQNPLKIVCD